MGVPVAFISEYAGADVGVGVDAWLRLKLAEPFSPFPVPNVKLALVKAVAVVVVDVDVAAVEPESDEVEAVADEFNEVELFR